MVDRTDDSGTGSLREAITSANASAGVPDVIVFAIPGTGVQTIRPLSELPAITDPLVIDGYSQGALSTPDDTSDDARPNGLALGSDARLLVEIDGSLAGAGANGLRLKGSDSLIRGLVINRFDGDGVLVTGASAVRNVIAGNFIGIDAAGTAAQANGGDGVHLEGGAEGNTIGGATPEARNVISGNDVWGVFLTGGGTSLNVVSGNYIGTNAGGDSPLTNGIYGFPPRGGGVAVLDLASNNTVGGAGPGAGNVISGNEMFDVLIQADGVRLQGNRVGTNAAGTATVGTSQVGVAVGGKGDVIGGNDADDGAIDGVVHARNLISVGGGGALGTQGNDVGGTRIQGNYVGTTLDGSAGLGSGDVTFNATSGLTFGGTEPGAGNVVTGKVFGFLVSHLVIQGNLIGRDAAGTITLVGSTLDIQPNADGDVLIGGTSPSARNVLASLLVGRARYNPVRSRGTTSAPTPRAWSPLPALSPAAARRPPTC
ncbi:MAG: hypothetical protein U0835_06160 [Isosphaeraceae bacterium]